MAFTVTIQEKPFYSIQEVMFITGLSRPVVKKNFELVKLDGTWDKIKLEDLRAFVDGKKGAE